MEDKKEEQPEAKAIKNAPENKAILNAPANKRRGKKKEKEEPKKEGNPGFGS